MSEQQTELKPVDSMTKAQLRDELERDHGETPSGSVTAVQLRERLIELRAAVEREEEPIEGEVVAEEEVEPTPEEATGAAVADAQEGQAQQLREAEGMALELRERAVGPTQTIPALAELNAISIVAERLASSGIVPIAYRGKPDDCVAAILMGRELGIGPMQSLKDIAVIDGKPALAAHLQLAVLRRGNTQGGIIILESHVDDERALIKAKRTDTGEIAEVEWTYEEAKKVISKSGKKLVEKDNWKSYRRDMLWARAVGRLTRRLGSDLVAGMPYTAEEVRDFDDDPYGYGTDAKPTYRQDAKVPGAPSSRAELLTRFAVVFGDGGAEDCREIAAAYIKEALQVGWGVERFADLGQKGNEAAQKIASAVMLLEEESPDLSLATGVRETVATAFAKRLDGIALVGPPWRLGPDEPNLPTREEYKSASGDASPAPGTAEPEAEGGEQPAIPPGEGDDDIPFGDDAGYES